MKVQALDCAAGWALGLLREPQEVPAAMAKEYTSELVQLQG